MDSESLIALLDSPDPYVRSDAALKLGELKLLKAETKLRAMCEEKSSVAALAAYHALWNMERQPASIALLMESLTSDDEELMQLAVQIVSKIGEHLLSPVIALSKQPNADLETLVMVLEEIGGNDALNALKEIPHDSDSDLSSLIDETIDDWEHE